MKKFYGIIVALIFILTTTVGCMSQNIYKQYNQALKKTSEIKKANQSITIELKADLENPNLTVEEKQMLGMYSPIKITFNSKYDRDVNGAYVEGNVLAGMINVPIKLYQKDNKMVLQVPAFPKYLVIDNINEEQQKNQANTELVSKIMNIWNEVVTKDNIKKVGKENIEVGSDKVDVTRFQLILDESKIKKLFEGTIDALFQDKQIKDNMIKSIKEQSNGTATDKDIENQLNEAVKGIKDSMNKVKFENFSYNGAFTKDLYIVDDNMSSDIKVDLGNSKYFKMNMTVKCKLWDIGKPVTIEMPALNKDNSFTLDEMQKNMTGVLGNVDGLSK